MATSDDWPTSSSSGPSQAERRWQLVRSPRNGPSPLAGHTLSSLTLPSGRTVVVSLGGIPREEVEGAQSAPPLYVWDVSSELWVHVRRKESSEYLPYLWMHAAEAGPAGRLWVFGGMQRSEEGQWGVKSTLSSLLLEEVFSESGDLVIEVSWSDALMRGDTGYRSPEGRWGHSLVSVKYSGYDEQWPGWKGWEMILFGGQGLSSPLPFSDTWSLFIPEQYTPSSPLTWFGVWPRVREGEDNRAPIFEKMPFGRTGHAAAIDSGRMFVFSGFDGVTTVDDFLVFDLSSRVWQVYPPRSGAGRGGGRYRAQVVPMGRSVFLLGGLGSDGKRLTDGLEFHLDSFSWSRLLKADVSLSPLLKNFYAACGVGNKAILLGGKDEGGVEQELCELDLSSRRQLELQGPEGQHQYWKVGRFPLRHLKGRSGYAVGYRRTPPGDLEFRIELFGGREVDERGYPRLLDAEEVDCCLSPPYHWQRIRVQPTERPVAPRWDALVTRKGYFTVVLFGETEFGLADDMLLFFAPPLSPQEVVCQTLWKHGVEGGPVPRRKAALAECEEGGGFYLYGGEDEQGQALEDLWFYQYDDGWAQLDLGSEASDLSSVGASLVATQGCLWFFFGASKLDNRLTPVEGVHCFSLGLKQLFPVITSGTPPSPRMGQAAVGIGASVVVYGGFGKEGEPLGDMFELDLDSYCWSEIRLGGSFLPPRGFPSLLELSGLDGRVNLLILGGKASLQESSVLESVRRELQENLFLLQLPSSFGKSRVRQGVRDRIVEEQKLNKEGLIVQSEELDRMSDSDLAELRSMWIEEVRGLHQRLGRENPGCCHLCCLHVPSASCLSCGIFEICRQCARGLTSCPFCRKRMDVALFAQES